MTNSTPADNGLAIFQKNSKFVLDKVDESQTLRLSLLFNEYFHTHVVNSSKNTFRAKQTDISDFLKFFVTNVQIDSPNFWTPSITKGFIKHLKEQCKLKPTSINRKLATLRHAASWMERKGVFKVDNPFSGVSDIKMGVISWKGLSDVEIMRLKSACDKRMAYCTRRNQNPLLETTVFYVLLHTGLREAELCALNYSQYTGKYLSYVERKGNKISEKVTVPAQAREFLERYLATRGNIEPDEPLFLNNNNKRITPTDVYYLCTKIKEQANMGLPEDQHCNFTPHSLRHAFLKRVADKMGIHVAQELSGNVSLKEIYRYTRPSFEETEAAVEDLY
jgi:integrase/recombinase XerD